MTERFLQRLIPGLAPQALLDLPVDFPEKWDVAENEPV
jgi:hypothetical protein